MLLKYPILILLFAGMSIFGSTPLRQDASPEKEFNVVAAALNFDTDIKPIFEKHCNPCHFPGGKLYDRLPFDQPSTIIKNEERILRRITDPAEIKMIQQFVEDNMQESEVGK